tara:strand:+ start:434 stop:1654 length:1221 start_codon:yes stop_codon:yes gene_type:complete
MKWIGGQTLYNDLRLVSGDFTVYKAVNNGNPTISLGSSATERLEIKATYESGAQGLDAVEFITYTAGSSASDGRFIFKVDEVNTFQIKDSLINIMESGKLTIGNVDILSDSSGTTTLSNIDALDATTTATIETAMEANLDTLGDDMTSAAALATIGTITTGVWNGTAIAADYMASATASAQGAVELATTGEADTGTDTARAVTPAGLKSHVDARYSYAYMVWSASGVSTLDGSDPEWVFPNTSKGIYEEDWNKDEGIKATSVGATTYTVTRFSAVNGLVVPHTGVCVGFHAHGRNDDSDVAFKAGLFHLEGSTTGTTNNGGVDYGNTGITNEATLRFIATSVETESSGGADGTSGHSFKGPCKLVSNTDALAVTAGDVLLPAIMGPDASDEIFITMTIILKVPLTT